ncbi:MAG: hypothetical protein V4524_03855 [Patescibacteria group bacterium]
MNTQLPHKPPFQTSLVTPGLRAPGADVILGLSLNEIKALATAEGTIEPGDTEKSAGTRWPDETGSD